MAAAAEKDDIRAGRKVRTASHAVLVAGGSTPVATATATATNAASSSSAAARATNAAAAAPRTANPVASKGGGGGTSDAGSGGEAKTAAQRAFERYDVDGNGVLDVNEVATMLREANIPGDHTLSGDHSDIFRRFDADGSGGITMSEFRVMWVQHQLAKYVAVEDGKAASGTAEAPANDEVGEDEVAIYTKSD